MANGNPYQQGSGKKKKKKNGAAQYASQTVRGGVGGTTAGPVYGQAAAAGPSGTQYPVQRGPAGTVYETAINPEATSSAQAKSSLANYQKVGFQGSGTPPPPNMGGGVVGNTAGEFYKDYGSSKIDSHDPNTWVNRSGKDEDEDEDVGELLSRLRGSDLGYNAEQPQTVSQPQGYDAGAQQSTMQPQGYNAGTPVSTVQPQGYHAGNVGGAQSSGPTYPTGGGQTGGPVYPQAVNVPGQPAAAVAPPQDYNAGQQGPTGTVYPTGVNVPGQPVAATPQGYNAGTQQSNVQSPQGAAALMEGYDASDPTGTGIGTQPQGYHAGDPTGTGANNQQGPSGTVYQDTMQPRGGTGGQTDAGLSDYIATTTGTAATGQQGSTNTGLDEYIATTTGTGTNGQQGPSGTVYSQTSTTQGQVHPGQVNQAPVHPGQVQPAATGSPEDAMAGQQPVGDQVHPGQLPPPTATDDPVHPGQVPQTDAPAETDVIASMNNAAASGDPAPEDWEGDVYEWAPPENTITPQIAQQHQTMLNVMSGEEQVPGLDAIVADNQRRRNQREQQHEQMLAMRGHSNSTFADQSRTDMAIAENAAAASLVQDTTAKYLHSNLPALQQMFGQGATSRASSLNEFFQFMDRQFRGDQADRANATANMSLLLNLMGVQTTPISTAPGYSPGAPPPTFTENMGGIFTDLMGTAMAVGGKTS